MKLIRYVGGGRVEVQEEAPPAMPRGGLLVRTKACGLCSGELMDWYMDRKAPHVLGHEVCGVVAESDDWRFPIGTRVFVHHHAPCEVCEHCLAGRFVHCAQWRSTRLVPGGMAEFYAAAPENLTDTLDVGTMRARDAALIEPLACVLKSISRGVSGRSAVIGLGSMGMLHLLMLQNAVGIEVNPARLAHALSLGLSAISPEEAGPGEFACVYVCPGSQAALDFGVRLAGPDGRIVLFAPVVEDTRLDLRGGYFRDLSFATSYSCGPMETRAAFEALAHGRVRAEQVVSEFVGIEKLPEAYAAMKSGSTLKAMVVFE